MKESLGLGKQDPNEALLLRVRFLFSWREQSWTEDYLSLFTKGWIFVLKFVVGLTTVDV